MNLEEVVKLNELFDAYGELLTSYQRDVLSDFLKFNLSFSEIAENRNVSRQAVFIVLNKCIKKLEEYEEKIRAVKTKKEFKNTISESIKLLEMGETEKALSKLKKGV